MKIVVESLTEGNPLTNDLPLVIDDFLMDLAQMHGEFDYSDIMDHKFSQEEIRKLRYLHKKYLDIAEVVEDENDSEIKEIVTKVAGIIKPQSSLTEDWHDEITTSDLMETAEKIENLIEYMDSQGLSSIRPIPNTYGIGSPFIGFASKGYVDLSSDPNDLEESITESAEGTDSELVGLLKKLKTEATEALYKYEELGNARECRDILYYLARDAQDVLDKVKNTLTRSDVSESLSYTVRLKDGEVEKVRLDPSWESQGEQYEIVASHLGIDKKRISSIICDDKGSKEYDKQVPLFLKIVDHFGYDWKEDIIKFQGFVLTKQGESSVKIERGSRGPCKTCSTLEQVVDFIENNSQDSHDSH